MKHRLPNPTELAHWHMMAGRLIDALDDGTIAEAIRRASIPSTADGYPSSTLGDGGSRGSDATSTTERAAMARAMPDPVSQGVGVACTTLSDAVHGIAWALEGIANTFRMAEDQRGRQTTVVECCEPACDDVATGRHAGRCEACYVWRRRHDGAVVPRSVIQGRSLRREVVSP